jgi:hypothetical protein
VIIPVELSDQLETNLSALLEKVNFHLVALTLLLVVLQRLW